MKLLPVVFFLLAYNIYPQDFENKKLKFYEYVGTSSSFLIKNWGVPTGSNSIEEGMNILLYEIGDQKGVYAFSIVDTIVGNSAFINRQADDIGTVFWYSVYKGLLAKDGFVLSSEQKKPKKSHFKRDDLNVTLELYKDDLGRFTIECRAFIKR